MIECRRMTKCALPAAIGALALLTSLSGCGPDAEAPKFTVSREGAYVAGVNSVANLRIDIAATNRNSRIVDAAAAAVRKIGLDWNRGALGFDKSTPAINVTVYAPSLPPQNVDVGTKVMHFSFDPAILGRTVHDSSDADIALASADDAGWWTPTNDDLIAAYCGEHAKSEFCRKFHDY